MGGTRPPHSFLPPGLMRSWYSGESGGLLSGPWLGLKCLNSLHVSDTLVSFVVLGQTGTVALLACLASLTLVVIFSFVAAKRPHVISSTQS